MIWKQYVKEYFEKNNSGTSNDIKHWICENKFAEVREDLIKWIEKTCDTSPYLKKVWYPLNKHPIDKMVYDNISRANITYHLKNLWEQKILTREETSIGNNKYLYKKISMIR